MEYVFRIHDVKHKNPAATAPVAAASVKDWGKTAYISGNLINNINISNNPRKMGTSIPSLFSRIFLFQTAFSTLGNNVNSHLDNNPNTKLVSECFDMLEFLFQNGQNEKLKVRHWNANNQIEQLKTDGSVAHSKLASILEEDINNSYQELADIFLFYWCDVSSETQASVEHLIGGTSPYTLVFTSPNWKKHMQSSGWSFNRLNATRMFDDQNPQALIQRADSFKKMIYGLYHAYSLQMPTTAPEFRTYCNLSWEAEPNKDPQVLIMRNNQEAFNDKYKIIEDSFDQILVKTTSGIPIVSKPVILEGSDYSIISTVSLYSKYTYENANIDLTQKPLVLNGAGITDAKYIGDAKWNVSTCKINEAAIRGVPLHKRTLPGGMGVRAPFVIASDFLEDKIVKVPYTISNEHFVTAFDGNSQYLLPLRPYFFEYFKIDDLDRKVDSAGNKMLSIKTKTVGSESVVEVTLRIPVEHKFPNAQYNTVVPLTKEYKRDSIITSDKAQLNIGFFPFFRVIDIPAADTANNMYTIALAGRNDVSLQFKDIKNNKLLDTTSSLRSAAGKIVLGSTYYDVDGDFDIVIVNVAGASALVVPKFKELRKDDVVTDRMSIAIDFGTSNTYVAIKKGGSNPEPLTISSESPQVVYLKEPKGSCNDQSIVLSQEILNREFIPMTLGQNDSTCSFPMRTATCELNNFASLPPKLFANISVGFNFQNEIVIGSSLGNFQYISNLKWALETQSGTADTTAYRNRVQKYFMGLLWIIKNKSLFENCGLPSKIYVTYPQAMATPTKIALEGLWRNAFAALRMDFDKIYMNDNESVAPYHAMATEVMGSSYMNIDIGGGTSDILYVVKEAGRIVNSYYCSTKFAADDLWGDGINIVQGGNVGPKDNGFKAYMDGCISQSKDTLDERLYQKYLTISQLAKNSSDVMGFLFKHDSEFQTSLTIQSQQNLYSLIFVHFAATLYNVARILKNKDLRIPEVLSFTGLGSKYTNMISSCENDLAQLSKIFLEQFTDKSADSLDVLRVSNAKEVTANGALMGPVIRDDFKVRNLDQVYDYGFEKDHCQVTRLKYQDVSDPKIRESVLTEYHKFIDSLKSNDTIKSCLNNKYGLRIQSSLLDDLEAKAGKSYDSISGAMQHFGDTEVNETLFFWPLKHAIYEVSKNFKNYK